MHFRYNAPKSPVSATVFDLNCATTASSSSNLTALFQSGCSKHVGVQRYDEFFTKANQLMPDDGIMLLHSVGHMSPPSTASSWLRKYIFPGAYSPSLSEVFPAVERNRLWVTDCEFSAAPLCNDIASLAHSF